MIETCIIVAIITFILLRNSNKKESSYNVDYAKFERDLAKGRLENQQTIENMRLEREIEAEVSRRIQKYKDHKRFKEETEGMDAHQMQMHPLCPKIELFNPHKLYQTIYDIDIAKYADVDILALIDEKVKARIDADKKSMLPAIKVIEKEEQWIIMENGYISKDDVLIDKDNNQYIVLEEDSKKESVIDNSTMPYFATERNVKRGKIMLDKGHEKINVGDLLYVDHSLKTYKEEKDDHMLFHECPYCNVRCNCSAQPCSCCYPI